MSDFEPTPVTSLEPTDPTPPAMPAPVRKKSNRTGNILLAVAGVVAIAGIAFAAGRFTAPAAAAAGNGGLVGSGNFPGGGNFPSGTFDPRQLPGGGPQGGFGRLGGTNLRGEVTAVTDTSITLRLENGSTIDVPIDSSTDYQSATKSTVRDVAIGSTVLVQPSDVQFNVGQPGASPNPASSSAPLTLGPAQQVIVLDE